jgi:hypothetical protein
VRAVLVAALVVGLILIPVIWPSQSPGGGSAAGDHASAAPAGAGYNFLRYNRSGTPVRWDPCTPIQYQLDLDAAPSWARSDLASALERISAATGIQFVPAGITSQFPSSQVPAGSAGAESPVVIAWADPGQSASLNLLSQLGSAPPGAPAPDVDSLAQTVPVAADDQVAGHMVYVSGSVILSSAAAQLPSGFKAGGEGVLMLHELGRLVGLGEVSDGRQVMSPQALSAGATDLGPGDRAGLGRLGSASGCLQVPRSASLEPVL